MIMTDFCVQHFMPTWLMSFYSVISCPKNPVIPGTGADPSKRWLLGHRISRINWGSRGCIVIDGTSLEVECRCVVLVDGEEPHCAMKQMIIKLKVFRRCNPIWILCDLSWIGLWDQQEPGDTTTVVGVIVVVGCCCCCFVRCGPKALKFKIHFAQSISWYIFGKSPPRGWQKIESAWS